MEFPTKYKVLDVQKLNKGNFSIVPIRFQDRINIMKWRNEQIYHLRQNAPLTIEDQINYFNNVVAHEFDEPYPKQILFSFLEDNNCIGYGGLVHINWIDKNAEISFIMETELEKDYFRQHWHTYLGLIEKVAFENLKLHKIYVYAFDLRPHLYDILKDYSYFEDARLKDHCLFDGSFKDVVIHSKIALS
ncbi:GNAT family N-acetyltransferase [Sediminicola luteus]|uniref:Ribosomal-protein-serine acetyltransferase n=1 Tax=Sediminicola luteus TaxID=319238 RepID=A0A2A4GEY2_9FLAO|nr:GNAT family N-acetyltransferase [Sediminicola luteus]PCE66558.1 ribosomal-protein-serine acetyltransferase [Sediminicola luteus]